MERLCSRASLDRPIFNRRQVTNLPYNYQRQAAPWQQAIHTPPEPNRFVESLEHYLADLLAVQHFSIQPPGRHSDFIELIDLRGAEAVLLPQRHQLAQAGAPHVP